MLRAWITGVDERGLKFKQAADFDPEDEACFMAAAYRLGRVVAVHALPEPPYDPVGDTTLE